MRWRFLRAIRFGASAPTDSLVATQINSLGQSLGHESEEQAEGGCYDRNYGLMVMNHVPPLPAAEWHREAP